MIQDTPMTPANPPPPTPVNNNNNNNNSIASILENYQTSTKTLLSTLSDLSSTATTTTTTSTTPNVTTTSSLLQTASCEILALKSHQRSACLLLEDKLDEVKRVRQTVDAHRLLLENLAYERDNLLKQIDYCRGFETRELERMAREEMGDTEGKSTHDVINSFLMSGNDGTEKTKNDDDGGGGGKEKTKDDDGGGGDETTKDDDDDVTSTGDYRDAKYHSTNVQKLRFDVDERRRLLSLLSQRNHELSRQEQSLKQKQVFLKDLPHRLEQVEAATLPLQEYFDVGRRRKMLTTTGGGGGGALASSERRKRVRMAEGLSGPLYTLASQIQGYVDAFDDEVRINVVDGAATKQGDKDAAASSFEYHPSTVTVTFTASPPPSSSGAPYKVTIHFSHCTTLNVVAAEAVVSGNKHLDASFLLRNLFPDDTGDTTPNLANYHHHSTTTTAPSQTTLTSFTNARPYLWVQYLSGLYFLPDDEPTNDDDNSNKRRRRDVRRLKKMSQNTASIMNQLKHRIRSHSTLFYLLYGLSSHPHRIPTPPPSSEGSTGDDRPPSPTPTVYLSSWTVVTDVASLPFAIVVADPYSSSSSSSSSSPRPSSSCIYYRAKIQKQGSSSSSCPLFETVVRISCEYPHIPPYWVRVDNGSTTSDATLSLSCPPLYNDDDEALLTKVNNSMEDLVSDCNETTENDDDDDDSSSSSHCYDWILCHQLKMILSYWEARANGTKQALSGGGGGGVGGGRVRMGRDRVYKGYYQ